MSSHHFKENREFSNIQKKIKESKFHQFLRTSQNNLNTFQNQKGGNFEKIQKKRIKDQKYREERSSEITNEITIEEKVDLSQRSVFRKHDLNIKKKVEENKAIKKQSLDLKKKHNSKSKLKYSNSKQNCRVSHRYEEISPLQPKVVFIKCERNDFAKNGVTLTSQSERSHEKPRLHSETIDFSSQNRLNVSEYIIPEEDLYELQIHEKINNKRENSKKFNSHHKDKENHVHKNPKSKIKKNLMHEIEKEKNVDSHTRHLSTIVSNFCKRKSLKELNKSLIPQMITKLNEKVKKKPLKNDINKAQGQSSISSIRNKKSKHTYISLTQRSKFQPSLKGKRSLGGLEDYKRIESIPHSQYQISKGPSLHSEPPSLLIHPQSSKHQTQKHFKNKSLFHSQDCSPQHQTENTPHHQTENTSAEIPALKSTQSISVLNKLPSTVSQSHHNTDHNLTLNNLDSHSSSSMPTLAQSHSQQDLTLLHSLLPNLNHNYLLNQNGQNMERQIQSQGEMEKEEKCLQHSDSPVLSAISRVLSDVILPINKRKGRNSIQNIQSIHKSVEFNIQKLNQYRLNKGEHQNYHSFNQKKLSSSGISPQPQIPEEDDPILDGKLETFETECFQSIAEEYAEDKITNIMTPPAFFNNCENVITNPLHSIESKGALIQSFSNDHQTDQSQMVLF